MKKNLLIWVTALILVVIAFYVTKNYNNAKSISTANQTQSTPSSNSQSLSTDDTKADNKAIDFTLTDLDGKKVSLKDFKGKNVYLNFWATWCPPCRSEMPEIEKVYQQYKDKDFVVLAVDLGEDKNTVKNFMQQNKYNFKVLLDSDQSVAAQYNITAIPVSYFIDKDGNIVAKRVGALSEEEMQSYVKQLIGK